MELIVDLHIHSHYSRATAKQMNLIDLYRWGKIKGINIIGTGDFTHPTYFKEIEEMLEPAEDGLYKLRDELAREVDEGLPETIRNNMMRFILTVEVSNIYSKGSQVRKVHNIVIVPDINIASQINMQLAKAGNLHADGRPTLGMDSKELLRITLDSHEDSLFIPAHIWTPWFAMFGSKSGFDSIEEAFEELASEICAVETGLSSDPYMNWRVKELQNITLVSNSDAHSPQKLGREANVIESELSYKDIIDAIKTNDNRFVGTIEFYPEEGKYHYDGHRVCDVSFMPSETKKHKGICPKCGKPLVVGVQNRVGQLAIHPEDYKPGSSKTVEHIIPLAEIVAEIEGVKSTKSKAVQKTYKELYSKFGDEFSILRKVDTDEVGNAGFRKLAEAIKRVRNGNVSITPGFDGVYGVVKVFDDEENLDEIFSEQTSLF